MSKRSRWSGKSAGYVLNCVLAPCCALFLASSHASLATGRQLMADGQREVYSDSPIALVDFSGLPARTSYLDKLGARNVEFNIPDKLSNVTLVSALEGHAAPASVSGGTSMLSNEQALELSQSIWKQFPTISLQDANATFVDEAIYLTGSSIWYDVSSMPQPRLATVWSPQHAGHRFESVPGSFLSIRNVTILDANATYNTFVRSSFFEYVNLGTDGRICFSSSALVLKSCEGFPSTPKHYVCCTTACEEYTYQAMVEILEVAGQQISDNVAPVTCVALDDAQAAATQAPRSAFSPSPLILAASITSAVAAGLAVMSAYFVMRRSSKPIVAADGLAQHSDSSMPRDMLPPSSESTSASHRHAARLSTDGKPAHSLLPSTAVVREQAEMQRLEEALESMRVNHVLYVDKYKLLPACERRFGAKGIVQFAFLKPAFNPTLQLSDSRGEFAIKFYTDEAAYHREVMLYGSPKLRGIMPKIHQDIPNSDGALCAPNGTALPPAIVMDRAESLLDFSTRLEHEVLPLLHALALVAKRVVRLHAAGVVHGKLTANNVLRITQTHAWVLTDLASTAETGSAAPLQVSTAYAAPEAIAALVEHRKSLPAREATDVWALAVIAYELLSQNVLFPEGTPTSEAHAVLLGEWKLPWERSWGSRIKGVTGLKDVLGGCLHRDADKRLSASQLLLGLEEIIREATQRSSRRGLDGGPEPCAFFLPPMPTM